MPRHFIVGTAGHIDHGKTSLVRALTGVDLDSLPEERDRGITIALGFTHLDLGDGRVAAFVDVPGHERLVRTMIAGASGLDAVLLCVSAVEGVMPQTREHLAILELLGVSQGLIALTMTDLVDEEMLELATLDVEEAVEGTFLEGAPVLHSAAPSQGPARGVEALREALAALAPTERHAAGPFRLPVDRAFVQRGFGTVVTGTVRSGSIEDGAVVEILPEGLPARIRGIQVHGQDQAESHAGLRTALNLAGVERDDLTRGHVIVRPGQLQPASIIDARVRHLAGAPTISHGSRVRLLVGTAEVMAVLSVLDDAADASGRSSEPALIPGREHWIQLRTESPLVALPGDRFVLRRESPVETLGGGEVLDPWARRARKRDHARVVDELQALAGGDKRVLLARAGDHGLDAQRVELLGIEGGVVLGDRVLHPERVDQLQAELLDALDRWHLDRPLTPGAPRRDLNRGSLGHLPDRVFDALVARAADAGELELEGPVIRRAGFQVRPTPQQQRSLDSIESEVLAEGLDGLPAGPLLARDADAFMLLVGRQVLHRVSDRCVHHQHLDAMVAQVRAHLAEHGELSPSDFKTLTGLSRRMAIPLLEWLDAQRITARQGDRRLAGPAC